MATEMRCVILAGGEWNQKFASSYIEQQYGTKKPDLVIAVDKGMERVKALNWKPDIILGDYDSVSTEVLKEYEAQSGIEKLQFPPEKDYTDLHLAIETAIHHGATEICILAATGTRLDHTFANMGLLMLCMQQGIPAELADSHNRIRMINHSLKLSKREQFGTYVSLIPYTQEVTGITLTGFRYPLTDATLTMGISRGVSNEIVEEVAEITLQTGCLFVIESKD